MTTGGGPHHASCVHFRRKIGSPNVLRCEIDKNMSGSHGHIYISTTVFDRCLKASTPHIEPVAPVWNNKV